MRSLINQSKPILIIDDNAEDLALMGQYLAPYLQEFPLAHCVSNLAEAEARVGELMPACCLLGISTGQPEDLLLLKNLRLRFPSEQIPIIVVAHEGSEPRAIEALQLGAQNYLIKHELNGPRLYGAIWSAVRTAATQQQLNHLVHYDALTGLLNRNLLNNRLEQVLQRCDRYKQRCALLYMNLDGFKPINETHGHSVGDALLCAVAERIKRNCRSTDSAARTGGDEFMVLIENADKNTGRKVADKLLKSLSSAFDIDGHSLMISASIGLAIYPDTAKNADDLIRQADQALSRAKQHAMVNFVSFSEQHKSEWQRQNTLERDLAKAIARNELALAYQPIVHSETFELRRLEVLSRWPREDINVNALELMEMIDRLNLIEAFHEWLFASAFGQMKKWQQEGIQPDLCLNIPANYCYSRSISQGIIAALNNNGIAPQRIELEITESTLMRFPERSVKVLQGLHDEGMRIAVDDFGTGYSSMTYLSSLPLDTLKIDRHFFLTQSNLIRNRKIIDAITALGHSLDLEIIAEGIETEVQLELANKVGCDLLQGFYFGRPAFAGENWSEYIHHFNHFVSPDRKLP